MTAPDARDLTTAFVHKDGRLAGRLTRTERGTEFTYDRDYLDAGCVPIASTLPRTEEPVVRPGRSVPAYFAGLLPEGRRLTSLRRTLKVSADDELSLLLAAGEDPVGDVSIGPTIAGPPPPTAQAGTLDWADVRFDDLLPERRIDPSSLAGVQDKVSGRMITVPLVHGGRAHFLKLTPPEFPQLVENEAFLLSHAARLPIPVTEWEVVHDRTGAAGLLVTRFDRVEGGDGLARLPAEDATQLLGLYPGDKYSVTSEDLMRAVANACSSRPLALRAVFVQIVWAWLTGNGDLHGKNVSIVGNAPTHGGTRAPEVVVAPAYDMPSTWPYGDHTLALPIDGRRTGLTRKRLLDLAARAGLPERAAARALDATLGVAAAMVDDIRVDASPWRGKARDDLAKALAYRLRHAGV